MTERNTRQLRGTTVYEVKSEAGAITFITMRPLRGTDTHVRLVNDKPVMAGDLGTHQAAAEKDPGMDRYFYPCDVLDEKPCLYSGFQSNGMLDLLADEGEDALFARLEDVHANTFTT